MVAALKNSWKVAGVLLLALCLPTFAFAVEPGDPCPELEIGQNIQVRNLSCTCAIEQPADEAPYYWWKCINTGAPAPSPYCCIPGSRSGGKCTAKEKGNPDGASSYINDAGVSDCTEGGGSTVKKVGNAATKENSQSMDKSAQSSSGSQNDSLAASDEVISLGGNQAATTAALYCAQAANVAIGDTQLSARDLKNCQDHFRTANELKAMEEKMGKKGGFSPDPATMSQDGAKSTLDTFAKNYGIESEDYMKKMLGSRGNMGEFADMLKSMLSEDKINAALNAAGALESEVDSSSKFAVELGAKSGGGKLNPKLRDLLKKKLDDGPAAPRHVASVPAEKGQKIGDKEHLEPLGENAIIAAAEPTREQTIFDVVHAKYLALTPRMHR